MAQTLPKILTADGLSKAGACSEAVAAFRKTFPKGLNPRKLTDKQIEKFEWAWSEEDIGHETDYNTHDGDALSWMNDVFVYESNKEFYPASSAVEWNKHWRNKEKKAKTKKAKAKKPAKKKPVKKTEKVAKKKK